MKYSDILFAIGMFLLVNAVCIAFYLLFPLWSFIKVMAIIGVNCMYIAIMLVE